MLTAVIARFGERAVAGYGAAVRVESLAMVLFFALSAVVGPLVAQNLAAGEAARVHDTVRLSNRACLAVGLVTAMVLFALAHPIAAAFSDDPDVQAITALYLRLVPVSAGAAGVVMVVNAALNASGRPLQALVISSARVLGLAVPGALLLAPMLGPAGVFVAVAAANLLAGAAAAAWYWRRVANSSG